ncbi:BMP family lipoprotein [Candidatus Halocynthiibacter alkanivorans]|uniref:BMP family lipoprotein n=1 Tax=Candidatus Halocynthiibacter alkanivorans TaxID=2267619 RepID=UPI000DF43FEA|nr:BMP family protein [Candidatus Halocynthiibacter alkanivorans]
MNLFKTLTAGAVFLVSASSMVLAEAPDKLRIGLLLATGPEAAWDATLLRDLDEVATSAPHGLDISYKSINGKWGEDAKNAMELLAKTGKYQIIWAHSSYSDQVKALQEKYPDILFVVVGSGNEALGGNAYWVFKRAHEPSYLLGVLAGRLTETDVIGVVGQFPSEDVNDQINGFFAGARSVNPDVQRKVAFIESWYDPAKAEQFTNAQIAAGADLTFQLVESFETCEKAGIMCFGNYVDYGESAPDSVVASALISWTQDLNWIIDEWYDYAANGVPYEGNTRERWVPMADGGSALSGFHAYEDKLPAELKEEIASLSARISSGELKLPVDLSLPSSD